jgi:hypothetical protein
MLIRIESSIHNGRIETRYINPDHILYIEKDGSKDTLAVIVLDVSRGERNEPVRLFVESSVEDLAKYINEMVLKLNGDI